MEIKNSKILTITLEGEEGDIFISALTNLRQELKRTEFRIVSLSDDQEKILDEIHEKIKTPE